MPYRTTHDVVRRVMPLIDRLARRAIDKARLLQYLSAQAGVDWGVHDLVADERVMMEAGNGLREVRHLVFRDRASAAEYTLRYPEALEGVPAEIEPLLIAEYKRLAVDRPLTMMAEPLFTFFFTEEFCRQCHWRGIEHEQVHSECRFAGYPINFDAESASTDRTSA